VHDQYVRELGKALTFNEVALRITCLTEKVVDCFTCNERFQGFVDMLKTLNSNGEVVKQFFSLTHVTTPFADVLNACLTSVHALDDLIPPA